MISDVVSVGNRTFIGAMFAQIVSSIALFTHHLDGPQWGIITSTILTIYATKSTVETKIQSKLQSR